MGLACSKRKASGYGLTPPTARISPFGKFSRRNSIGSRHSLDEGSTGPDSLLDLAIDKACGSLFQLPLADLRSLPTDLAQLILDRLIQSGRLNDAAVLRLAGQTFHQINIDAYSEPIRDFWLRYLATSSLEKAVIRRTTMDDHVLQALPCLPHLHTLHLEFCIGLTDDGLCAALTGLPALRDLSLAGCERITALGIEWICRLPTLTSLNLEQCHRVSGLDGISKLVHLETLNLGWCRGISDVDMSPVGKLSNLQNLRICHTQVGSTGLANLTRLHKLKSLSLAGIRASDAAVAAVVLSLPGLRKLDLNRCMAVEDGTMSAIGRCPIGLQELDIAYTDISDDGMGYIQALTNLQRLNLDSTAVGDDGLQVVRKFESLEFLDLSDTAVTGMGLNYIKGLKKLHTLNLSFTGIDNGALKRITPLTSLRKLNLDSRQFSDAALEHVVKLTNLETLDLFGAYITDVGCAHLSAMTSLKSLEICGGGISDTGVARLTTLNKLKHLSLGQNYRVTNASIQHVLKLPQLTALNLSQCRVTSNTVVALGCLPNLQVLALHGTRVKPVAVEKLRAMNGDLEVLGIGYPDMDR